MLHIQIVGRLTQSRNGPVVQNEERDYYRVLLRQGSADGACGPYSVLMALSVAGVEAPERVIDVTSAHHKTKLGKLYRALTAHPDTLFSRGTTLKQLEGLLVSAYRDDIGIAKSRAEGEGLTPFVLGHLALGHPVVVGFWSESGWAHWAVAVGLHQHILNGERCLLLLDPDGEPAQGYTAWNSLLWMDWAPGEKFPHLYNEDVESQVEIAHAIAIWKR